jgi:aryl-alcohol dehydrogenase-like predicted oxidoreductase
VRANALWIVDGMTAYIHKCIDLSLKRPGLDHISLYFLRRLDPLVPIEDTMGALADMLKQGKVRYRGVSEVSLDTIRRAARVGAIAALQSEDSL